MSHPFLAKNPERAFSHLACKLDTQDIFLQGNKFPGEWKEDWLETYSGNNSSRVMDFPGGNRDRPLAQGMGKF
jgi:hypothetical protein